jgi:phytol kinase
MLEFLLTLIIIGIVLVLSEYLLREKVIHGEIARKFVHISTGLFISTWAFYLSVGEIQIISILLLVGVLISQKLKIFKSIRGVDRKTWGEVLFAISVGLTITIAPSAWIYAIAILHMSLADGMAAVVGAAHGSTTKYKIFGYTKSLVGSGTFYLCSMFILLIWVLFGISEWQSYYLMLFFWVPFLSTLTENLAVKGIDNVAVPIIVIAVFDLFNKVYA